MKSNPWLEIDALDYEKHMSHSSVSQLQILSHITKEQLDDNKPREVLILGIATGNGLEHIDNSFTRSVYGVDINRDYLDICTKRYSRSLYNLNLYNLDLSHELLEGTKVDLVIANLILEYVPPKRILEQVKAVSTDNTVISISIQRNNTNSFVSNTGVTSLNILNDLHKDIEKDELVSFFNHNYYRVVKEVVYNLPNGKDLIRIDLNKN